MEFQIYTQEEKETFLSIFNQIPFPIKIKFDRIYKQRSAAQNAYLHKIITMYAEHLGMRMDVLKEELQKRYLLVRELVNNGNVIYEVKSTATLNTKEMEEFAEKIRQEAIVEHMLYLPLPGEIINEENEYPLKFI